MEPLDADGCAEVDDALQAWRQGDCVIGQQWFVFRTDLERPLTADGAATVTAGADNAEPEVSGFVVLTQTCDLVRKSSLRPFVEVCPLVEVDEAAHQEIVRRRRPNYASIPALADQRLVADLDRVMTVEKSVVAGWTRVEGCQTDNEVRHFADALARKRARVAFPDDFVGFVSPLMSRVSSKHDKQSDEGAALQALREIRVRAAPSWDAGAVALTFWFIRHADEPTFKDLRWDRFLEEWKKRIQPTGRFTRVDAVVLTLDDLTAREYTESDRLDLDHLSTRE